MLTTIDPEKLKPLLGQTLRYQGMPCQVIEVLANPPALVLQGCQERKVIQPTQYGDAGDWIVETFTVALLSSQPDSSLNLESCLADIQMYLDSNFP